MNPDRLEPEPSGANQCTAPAAVGTQTVEQAIARILAAERPVPPIEQQPLDDCLGRVLAAPLVSRLDQPNWDHSAMDGFALRSADLARDPPRWPISQRIAAGAQPQPLAPGTAARIFTGAPVPPGADTVAIQEICAQEGDWLRIQPADLARIQAGANIRRRGEDIQAGDTLIAPGTRLEPQHLALAAAVGETELPVYRPLRIALLTSGDELIMPGRALQLGQIYNSNRFMLHALVRMLGCEPLERGRIPDRLDETVEALRQAAEDADLVIASGGVSVGEEDHVRPAVERLGQLEVGKVAMRPGKPVAIGQVAGTPFIGSPGNPVSLFVTFLLFARPLILQLQGQRSALVPRVQRVIADFETKKADPRREYQRARLTATPDGQYRVQTFPSRSSAAINSLTWAHGLVVIPEHTRVRRGDLLDFLPFSELRA